MIATEVLNDETKCSHKIITESTFTRSIREAHAWDRYRWHHFPIIANASFMTFRPGNSTQHRSHDRIPECCPRVSRTPQRPSPSDEGGGQDWRMTV